jgi:flagellar biosynthesis GTPase FlhF
MRARQTAFENHGRAGLFRYTTSLAVSLALSACAIDPAKQQHLATVQQCKQTNPKPFVALFSPDNQGVLMRLAVPSSVNTTIDWRNRMNDCVASAEQAQAVSQEEQRAEASRRDQAMLDAQEQHRKETARRVRAETERRTAEAEAEAKRQALAERAEAKRRASMTPTERLVERLQILQTQAAERDAAMRRALTEQAAQVKAQRLAQRLAIEEQEAADSQAHNDCVARAVMLGAVAGALGRGGGATTGLNTTTTLIGGCD